MSVGMQPFFPNLPTDADLLAALKSYSFVRPVHIALSFPCAHFSPATDFDELAQDVVEGRRRHRPRDVFAPNSFSKQKGRK